MRTRKHIRDIVLQGEAISKKIMSVGILSPTPLQLTSPLERVAHHAIEELNIQFPVAIDRNFYLKCFLVPAWCSAVVQWYIQQHGIISLWMGEFGTPIVANERMLLEAAMLKPKSTNLAQQMHPKFWSKRFDEWRTSAQHSIDLYIDKQSYVLRTERKERFAAFLGVLERESGGLPAEIFASELSKIQNRDAVKTFAIAKSSKAKIQWTQPELETWIIEIWPLVTRYGWNYHDIWLVACDIWDFDTDDPLGKSARATEDRCKALGLKLASRGSARRGRQKGCSALMKKLALWITPVGADKELWIGGQFSRGRVFASI